MINELKRLTRKLTLLEVATRELAEAELGKLTAQTAQEFAESVVAYNVARIKRLKSFIKSQTIEEAAS